MSLSDCIKCWDTPCTCGWEYRDWSIEQLEHHAKMLNKILFFRKQSPNLKFSIFFSAPETEDDKRFMEYMKE